MSSKNNLALAFALFIAIALWGGNNVGTKWLVAFWPPVFTGGTRFLCAGLLLLAVLHWTRWLGAEQKLSLAQRREFWWRGGLSLAGYVVVFNSALRLTSASHVALFLGASPVWALLWEGMPARTWRNAQRYGAATLALAGVILLFWPALRGTGNASLSGDILGLLASVLWTLYGRQCRVLGSSASGAQVAAHSMWRAGCILMPLGLIEVSRQAVPLSFKLLLVQGYCVVAGGVMAFGIWSLGLRRWPTSRVMLFNNLIPLSTMTWAHFCLDEVVTSTFWIAMVLIAAGVLLGQTNLKRVSATAAMAQPEL